MAGSRPIGLPRQWSRHVESGVLHPQEADVVEGVLGARGRMQRNGGGPEAHPEQEDLLFCNGSEPPLALERAAPACFPNGVPDPVSPSLSLWMPPGGETLQARSKRDSVKRSAVR